MRLTVLTGELSELSAQVLPWKVQDVAYDWQWWRSRWKMSFGSSPYVNQEQQCSCRKHQQRMGLECHHRNQ